MKRILTALAGLALVAAAALPQAAEAGRPALDPKVRAHLGASMVEGPAGFGVMGGIDSRLTRNIFVDIGAVWTPGEIPDEYEVGADEPTRRHYRIRHSVYVAPGMRIPHPTPLAYDWDVIFRAGPAMTWTADLDQTIDRHNLSGGALEFDAATFAGVDALLKTKQKGGALAGVGLRGSAKVFLLNPFQQSTSSEVVLWAPQFGLEALYEF